LSSGNVNEIKDKIDNIIECLASETEPVKLQDVAEQLLRLQALVGNIQSTSESQRVSEKTSPTSYQADFRSTASSQNYRQSTGTNIEPSNSQKSNGYKYLEF
jgi:hypothetical protein